MCFKKSAWVGLNKIKKNPYILLQFKTRFRCQSCHIVCSLSEYWNCITKYKSAMECIETLVFYRMYISFLPLPFVRMDKNFNRLIFFRTVKSLLVEMCGSFEVQSSAQG